MRRVANVLFALGLAATLFGCRSSEFGSLVRAVEEQPGIRKQRIPMLGLVRAGVRVIHPAGLYDFRVAVFEHSEPGPATRLDEAISGIAKRGWVPVVKVSSGDGERTTVWARESPRGMRMLVLSREQTDSVVVELEMDAERFFRELASSPGEMSARAHP